MPVPELAEHVPPPNSPTRSPRQQGRRPGNDTCKFDRQRRCNSTILCPDGGPCLARAKTAVFIPVAAPAITVICRRGAGVFACVRPSLRLLPQAARRLTTTHTTQSPTLRSQFRTPPPENPARPVLPSGRHVNCSANPRESHKRPGCHRPAHPRRQIHSATPRPPSDPAIAP